MISSEQKMQFLYTLRSRGVTDPRVLDAMERIDEEFTGTVGDSDTSAQLYIEADNVVARPTLPGKLRVFLGVRHVFVAVYESNRRRVGHPDRPVGGSLSDYQVADALYVDAFVRSFLYGIITTVATLALAYTTGSVATVPLVVLALTLLVTSGVALAHVSDVGEQGRPIGLAPLDRPCEGPGRATRLGGVDDIAERRMVCGIIQS